MELDSEPILKNQSYTKLRIKKIVEEIRGIKSFVLDKDADIPYEPGQYLTIVHDSNVGEIRRSYSITSVPFLNEPLTICIKRVENGAVSRPLIDRIKEGDMLFTTGAAGFFVLPDDLSTYKQIFFFAAGVGITPVYALLKTVLHRYPHLTAVLIYSNRSIDYTLFYKELNKLEESFTNRLKIEYINSNDKNLARAHLHRELLVSLLTQYSVTNYQQTLFYICGPEAYMRMCIYSLQEAHVPKENIKKENFNTLKPIFSITPPDKSDRIVTIIRAGKEERIEVRYPDSILKAAQKKGLLLPYSCEAGRCGSCAAICTHGSVWMSYNEVLTDAALNKGLVLTCTGHPVGEGVVLKI